MVRLRQQTDETIEDFNDTIDKITEYEEGSWELGVRIREARRKWGGGCVTKDSSQQPVELMRTVRGSIAHTDPNIATQVSPAHGPGSPSHPNHQTQKTLYNSSNNNKQCIPHFEHICHRCPRYPPSKILSPHELPQSVRKHTKGWTKNRKK